MLTGEDLPITVRAREYADGDVRIAAFYRNFSEVRLYLDGDDPALDAPRHQWALNSTGWSSQPHPEETQGTLSAIPISVIDALVAEGALAEGDTLSFYLEAETQYSRDPMFAANHVELVYLTVGGDYDGDGTLNENDATPLSGP